MSERLDGERDLVARIREGDKDAVREVLREFGPRLLQTALRFFDREEAHACIRRTIRKAMRSLTVPTREQSLWAQLHRALLVEAVRGVKISPTDRDTLKHLLPSFDAAGCRIGGMWQDPVGTTLEDLLSSKEHRTLVRDTVDQLPAPQRAAFILHDVEGLSPSDSAEILQVSLTAQRSLLHGARTAVTALLGRALRSEDP